MSNKTYDTLKTIALLLVPVLAFIAALVNIWEVPHADQIVATLTALDTLAGAIVVAAGKAYHKSQSDEPADTNTEDQSEG